MTALHAATKAGDVEEVRHLLAAGADPMYSDGEGLPIHDAFSYKSESVTFPLVRLYLEAGVPATAVDCDRRSVLQYACMWSTAPVVSALLDAGAAATINVVDGFGYTAVHDALVNLTPDRDAVLRLVLDAGADMDQRQGPFAEVMIHAAIYRRSYHPYREKWRETAALLLLEHGADWHVPTHRGSTLLHLAAEAGMKQVVAWLLAAGADVWSRDEEGRTPLELATEGGCRYLLTITR